MPYRGSVNRRTGKTTPRKKTKTHWGARKSAKRSLRVRTSAARSSE